METSGLIDRAAARGEVMFLPVIRGSSTWVTALVNHSVGGRRRRGGRTGMEVAAVVGIPSEQELLMLNAQAIVAKQPL